MMHARDIPDILTSEHIQIKASSMLHIIEPPSYTHFFTSLSIISVFSPLLPLCTVLRFASLHFLSLAHNFGYFGVLLHLYFASSGPEQGQNIVHCFIFQLSPGSFPLHTVCSGPFPSVKRTKYRSHMRTFTPLRVLECIVCVKMHFLNCYSIG